MRVARGHPLWFAYLLHRLSGLGLALFLPFHFWVLSWAIRAPERLDGFLRWSDLGLVKLAEVGLVFLLAVHAFGGLRLMAMEALGWTSFQKTVAAGAVAGAAGIALLFGLSAI